MSRDLDAALVTEFTASSLRPVMLAEFAFDSGTVRLWNGIGDLTVGSDTYTGAGNLISVSEYQETSKIEAQGFTFTLSGISSSILSIALAENYQGRRCNLYICALDTAGVLVSSPYQIFSGRMDTMQINESGETCSVALSAENNMVILQRAKERRYTSEDQRALYPDDAGLDFVAGLQDKEIIWKAAT